MKLSEGVDREKTYNIINPFQKYENKAVVIEKIYYNSFLLLLTKNFAYKGEGFMNKKIKTLFCRKRVLFLRKIKAEKAVL